MSHELNRNTSRREFLKTSTLAAGAVVGGLSWARSVHAAGDDVLRLGLVGCGGRGSGAASNALAADSNVRLTAMGDLFDDHIQNSVKTLSKQAAERKLEGRIDVPSDRRFVGFDAYQKVIDSGVDVVILATPPHFRPAHLEAVVAAGKHCFVEKPVAVDAPGVRRILKTCEEAERKGLSIVSGLCYRYDIPKRETYRRVHDGAIGDVLAMQVSYLTSTLKKYPRQSQWSDMEWQLRNWQYFTWLSGDHNVEQHIHSLDKAAWAMHDEPPVKCLGTGGRQMRDPNLGNVYDHFDVVYEYAGGQKLFARCRQMDGCDVDVSDYLIGTKGKCSVMSHSIDGENKWRFRANESSKAPNMYQQEHDDLFAAIRASKPINNGLYMARSTLLAIMGRMSAYTGKEITWQQALASQEDLSPAKYEWGSAPDAIVAQPGITKLI